MRSLAPALALVVFLAPAACGGGAQGPARATAPPATQGVRDYIAALRSDDPRPAYEMLAADVRDDVPYEEFSVRWKKFADEREFEARKLEESLKGRTSLGERSRIRYADGKTVVLVREGDRWKLDSALVSRTHASEPHDALTIFAEALEAHDYDAVIDVLTERRRQGIARQIDQFIESLNQNLPQKMVDQIGQDRAEARWEDDGIEYKIVLRKEGDEWRVDDVDLRPVLEQDGEGEDEGEGEGEDDEGNEGDGPDQPAVDAPDPTKGP